MAKKMFLAAVCAGMVCFGGDGDAQKPAPKGLEKHLGGFVIQPGTLKGKFAVVDAQSIAGEVVGKTAQSIAKAQRITVERVRRDGSIDIGNMGEVLRGTGANGCMVLAEDDALPALIVAPEENWGIVNVRALAKDGAKGEKFEQRVYKEMLRCFAMVCGAADTGIPGCVLQPVAGLEDLDGMAAAGISMMRQAEISAHMEKMGITPYRRVPYRTAAREGWAAAPTNEWQQAIWEKAQEWRKERGRK